MSKRLNGRQHIWTPSRTELSPANNMENTPPPSCHSNVEAGLASRPAPVAQGVVHGGCKVRGARDSRIPIRTNSHRGF